ncbi:MAG: ThuA domain-containing protein [Planctomycetaceae bacterium]
MTHFRWLHLLTAIVSLCLMDSIAVADPVRIVLVAGETAEVDTMGHHDYLAGCECLRVLLSQSANVEPVRVNDGWPSDDGIFDGAAAIVFYTDGGGKQAFLNSPERTARVQALVDSGVGLVMIHQAVDFPEAVADQARSWLGGIYQKDQSGRGHWPSAHVDFPDHPVCRGVTPWKVKDGWLNGIQFVADRAGVTPLVWSGKDYEESSRSNDADIVAWTFDRPDKGRSFCFTGLDAHSAWELPGMTQLVVNGILWSAHQDIPAEGAPSSISKQQLDEMLTPRKPKPSAKKPAKTSERK